MSKFVNYGNGLLDMSFGMQNQPWMLLNLINNDDMLEVVTDSCHDLPNMVGAFETQLFPYYNGRERGFWFKMWIKPHVTKNLLKIKQNTCLNMVWFEHRNSDSMIVLKWIDEGSDEHPSSEGHHYFRDVSGTKDVSCITKIEDRHNADVDGKINFTVPYITKWQYTKEFEYLNFGSMLKYFWGQVEEFITHYSNMDKVLNHGVKVRECDVDGWDDVEDILGNGYYSIKEGEE